MSDLVFAADAAELLGLIADADGYREFKPHTKQGLFLDATEREVFLLGSNRSGKSKVGAALAARWVRKDGKRKVWIVCPSFAMARQNILGPLFGDADNKAMIPEQEIESVREKPEWQYVGKDGWEITIKSCEQGASKFAGAAVDGVIFDEPPEWPVYNECAIRFGAGKTCLLRMTATLLPPVGQAGGICQWLWSEKIEPWLAGKAHHDLKIIQVAMQDNPYITPEQLALARRLYAPGSLDLRIRVNGELLPGLIGARCYSRFDRRIQVNKNLSRVNVDPLRPLYLGPDFNVDPLAWPLLQKHGQVWRVLDEISLRPGTVPDACDVVIQRYANVMRNTLVVCGDATGRKRTAQTGQSDYDLMVAKLKDHFNLKLITPERNPPERDRINLVNFFLGGGDSDVRLEIAGSCPETIADAEQTLWNKDASGILKSHDKNTPYYYRTHWMDGVGYVLHALEAGAIRQLTRNTARRSAPIPAPYYGFNA